MQTPAYSTVAEPQSTTFRTAKDDVPLVRLELDPNTRIFVLYLLGEQTPDNRLTHEMILEGILPALEHVKAQWADWVANKDIGPGAALVTSALTTNKIFSNGLDLQRAIADPKFFDQVLNGLFRAYLTLPIPSVASVGGHAFAAGFTLACAHDYRVQNGHRGYVCLNEIEFGAPVPTGMTAMLRTVTSAPTTLRKIILEGHRFNAQDAFEHKLVDVIAQGPDYEGPAGTLKKSIELAMDLRSRSVAKAYGVNRERIYREQLEELARPDKLEVV